jgi:hypothetical protein
VIHLFKRSSARFRHEKESPNKWQQAKYRKKTHKLHIPKRCVMDGSLQIKAENIVDCTDQCSVPVEILRNPSVGQQEILLFRTRRARAMMKLFSQLEQVNNATPLARSDDGNISAEGISLRLKHWSHP